jgi:acetyl esterase/lipase
MLTDLAAKSGFAVLNALEPRGFGSVRHAIAYGPEPRQTLDVYAPRKAHDAPVALFLPGGGWRRGGRRDYAFVGRRLARAGFVAVVADYRLYPAVRFPAFAKDAAAAVAWTRTNARRYGGDAGRLYLMGFSAGAHLAALLAIDSRYLAAHGLVSRDLAGVVGLAGPYDLLPETSPRNAPIFAGAGEAARPAALVRRAPPPLLLMHGDADTVVPLAHTRRLAEAAKRAGGRVVVHEYEKIGHTGLLLALSARFADRAPVLSHLAAFIEHEREQPERRYAAAR